MNLSEMFKKYQKQQNKKKNITIGEFTYGQPTVHMWTDKYKVKIGKFCSFSYNNTIIVDGNHRIDWVSTYPFGKLIKDREFRIISRRGSAHEFNKESDTAKLERLESKLILHAKVVEVNERFVKFEILDGSIEIDGKTYDVDKGKGWAIVRKFGWIAINGE